MVNVSHVNLWQYSRKSQLWNYMQRNTCIHVQVKVTSHQTTVQFNYIATKWFCITWFPVSIYFRFFFFVPILSGGCHLDKQKGLTVMRGDSFIFPKFKGGITSAAFYFIFFFFSLLFQNKHVKQVSNSWRRRRRKKKSFWLTDWIELWYLSVKLLVKIVETPHDWEQKFFKRRMAGLVFHFTRSVLRLKPWVGSVVKVGALYSISCGLFLVNSPLNSLDFFFYDSRLLSDHHFVSITHTVMSLQQIWEFV